uniref:PiggyBac transposable element-derived protein 4-like n=1 Tax=Crassostrea virginica TaxID=6565 RepID=A0A8B8AID7_CRAVI|nr:piggyBac transposable element-derived protein 4-like [Crassostrea virginica]
MADSVRNIIDEIFADSDSDGEENFEGFDLEDFGPVEIERNQDNSNYDVLNEDLWAPGDRTPHQLTFTGKSGLCKELDDCDSPRKIFELFIDDSDYENVSEETNRYAAQFLHDKVLKEKSRFQKWKDTCASEMKKFSAIILAMGILTQMDVSEYWTVNPVTSTPFFPSVMSRDRFLLLLAFIHLNDNSNHIPRGMEGYDPLFKLGPIYQKILSRFHTVYAPHQALAIDESMVAWHGNLSFRVYSPDKPIKYGLKAYMLCDAENAYCLKFKLYTGKSSVRPSENGATYDLVMDLLRNYYEKGHILFCDNYYSSPRLFMDLWILGTGATGTVRQYRKGIPKIIKDCKLSTRGETSTVHYGPLSCLKYQDSKTVYLISTTETSNIVTTSNHDFHTNETKIRPSMVHVYDKKMGAVDRNNQMVENYKLNIKTLKWWKKLFFHLINVAIVNSYIIYKECTTRSTPMVQRHFRRRLVEELLEYSGQTNVAPVGRPAPKVLERLTGRHFVDKFIEGGKTLHRQCIVCGPAERKMCDAVRPGEKRRFGHMTSYKCKQCNVPLCITPCFEIFHTKQEPFLAYKRMKSAEANCNTEE